MVNVTPFLPVCYPRLKTVGTLTSPPGGIEGGSGPTAEQQGVRASAFSNLIVRSVGFRRTNSWFRVWPRERTLPKSNTWLVKGGGVGRWCGPGQDRGDVRSHGLRPATGHKGEGHGRETEPLGSSHQGHLSRANRENTVDVGELRCHDTAGTRLIKRISFGTKSFRDGSLHQDTFTQLHYRFDPVVVAGLHRRTSSFGPD